MKLSIVRDYFEGTKTSGKLKDELKKEIAEYIINLKKKGSSVPIHVDDDVKLFFGKKELLTLGNSFLNQELTALEIGYIADGLLLSNQVEFKSEKVIELLEQLTDPEINGDITESSVRELIQGVE